ncbi:DUF3363 domain-containing protein, partial [Salmonella enterica]
WRPIIHPQLDREVMGIVQGGSVSWQLGRQRGLERCVRPCRIAKQKIIG